MFRHPPKQAPRPGPSFAGQDSNASWNKRSCTWAMCCALVLSLLLPGPAPARALDRGTTPPEIGLNDLQGKPVTLAALKGKVVIVDFWASWCGPCKEELPVLQKLYARYASRGLVVVGVNIDNDLKSARRFVKKLGLTFPVVHDAAKRVVKQYAPPKMPSSYILGRDGKVHHIQEGFRASEGAEIEKHVLALLNRAR